MNAGLGYGSDASQTNVFGSFSVKPDLRQQEAYRSVQFRDRAPLGTRELLPPAGSKQRLSSLCHARTQRESEKPARIPL